MSKRGPYAKGALNREKILRAALDVYANEGYRGASVRQIAESAGLSQTGVLHYFASKEQLYVEILRKRDQEDVHAFFVTLSSDMPFEDGIDHMIATLRHNATVPGLVQLYSQMLVDAADPAHPAHPFFQERNRSLTDGLTAVIADAQRRGKVVSQPQPAALARLLLSALDGAQLHWALDPESVDLTDVLRTLVRLLSRVSSPA